jgi:hypothetical protein
MDNILYELFVDTDTVRRLPRKQAAVALSSASIILHEELCAQDSFLD